MQEYDEYDNCDEGDECNECDECDQRRRKEVYFSTAGVGSFQPPESEVFRAAESTSAVSKRK